MKQTTALEILKAGHNVFLTGSAGTGKTYLLNQYIDYLKERDMVLAITAPTGIAASHINGMTIHSFFGIGIREDVDESGGFTPEEQKELDDLEKEFEGK